MRSNVRLRTGTDQWTALFLATMGVSPLVSCGGNSATAPNDAPTTGGGTASGSGGSTGNSSSAVASTGSSGTTGTGSSGAVTSTGNSGNNTSGIATSSTGAVAPGLDAGPDARRPSFACENPTPVFNDATGYFSCANGSIHRTTKVTCTSSVPRAGTVPDAGVSGTPECASDSDCTASPHGFCARDYLTTGGPPYHCVYGCVTDDECPGGICVCGDPVGLCRSATCVTDADCGAGFLCSSSDNSLCSNHAFACQTPNDSCAGNTDCAGICPTPSTGSRSCQPALGCVGRPFWVDGAERLAALGRRSDWLAAGVAPATAGLSAAARAHLATAWSAIGQMEHASVAAFARFALQLLAHGAPADLVERSAAAMADETRHAKLAFALASTYGGRPIGPAVLDIDKALDAISLEQVIATTIREGCVGETTAAIEAVEALEHATDPAVRAVLARIAEDETRHAELAWRFVRWAVERGGEEVRCFAWREIERAVGSRMIASPSNPAVDAVASCHGVDGDLLAHGILTDALRHKISTGVAPSVVKECALALLGAPKVRDARLRSAA